MPSPYHPHINLLIAHGFCRTEVQKVLRKYRKGGLSARDCVTGWSYAHLLFHPFPVFDGKLGMPLVPDIMTRPGLWAEGKRKEMLQEQVKRTDDTREFSKRFPAFFADIVSAVVRVETSEPANEMDRLIQANVDNLRNDFETNEKLGRSLNLDLGQLKYFSTRIGDLNKIVASWLNPAYNWHLGMTNEQLRAESKRCEKLWAKERSSKLRA